MPHHPIEASPLQARRERVFLVLAGLFLGTLAMLNILGLLRFIYLGEMETSSFGTRAISLYTGRHFMIYFSAFFC